MQAHRKRPGIVVATIAAVAVLIAACSSGSDSGSDDSKSLTVYSGRNEQLVGPVIDGFTEKTGIQVEVRYGKSAELAALLVKEGDKTPADVFYAQDAGATGSVALEGLYSKLPGSITSRVEPRFVGTDNDWVGITGRARVIVYNTDKLDESQVPTSVFDLTAPEWKGRVGIAPTNASFQAFVSAMRLQVGDDKTKQWLEDMKANDAQIYANNIAIVEATIAGEIDAGLVNSYYLPRIEAESGGNVPAKNFYLEGGDPGALVNVSGAGILKSASDQDTAAQFVEYLLSDDAQKYFTEKTYEYALVAGIPAPQGNPPLSEVEGSDPNVDLTKLGEELPSTIKMLEETGLL